MDTQTFVTVVVGFLGSGALVAFVNQYFLRRQTAASAKKTDAESGKIEIEASAIQWLGIVDQHKDITKDVQEQLDQMRQRANAAEEEVIQLQKENSELQKKVTKLEIKEIQLTAKIEQLVQQVELLTTRLQKVEQDTGSMRPVKG